MALPKLNEERSYTAVKLPSGKSIGVHPWRVKEEKELLFAIENLNEMEDDYVDNARGETIKFIKRCTDEKVPFDDLSNTDILRVATELRKISKGDTIEYEYGCPHCGNRAKDIVDLNKHIKVKPFDKKQIIAGGVIFNIKEVPASKLIELIKKYGSTFVQFNYNYVLASVDTIVVEGEIFQGFTEEELIEFLDQLKSEDYAYLVDTLNAQVATFEIERAYKCFKCKNEVVVEFGDLYHFLIF